MDKLERLLNLTAALLDTERPLTAEDLRERVGGYPEAKASFRRTFERDKDDLRSMGVPVRVESVPGVNPPVDGYRIDRREYEGHEVKLEPDELAALHVATNLIRLDGGADDALRKLGGGTLDQPSGSALGHVPFNDELGPLVNAATARQAVQFRYNDVDRVVEPWRVSFQRGHWYLAGFDRVRDSERVYRVDRIDGSISECGPAEHPVGTTTDPGEFRGWELGDGDAIMAKVLVDADQASWARHQLRDAAVDQPDGSVELTLQVRNVEGFRSFVLTFLDHAEVVSPPELRDDMIAWLTELAQ